MTPIPLTSAKGRGRNPGKLGRPEILSPVMRHCIAEHYRDDGFTVAKIAQALKVGHATVRKYLQAAGVTMRSRGGANGDGRKPREARR